MLEKYFHSQPLPHKDHKNSKNVPNQGHCFKEIALDSQDHCHEKSPGRLGGCGISQNAYWKPELSLLSQKQRNQKQWEGYVPPSRFVFRLLKSSIAYTLELHTRVGILVGIGWYFVGKYQPIPKENSVGIFRYYKFGGSVLS